MLTRQMKHDLKRILREDIADGDITSSLLKTETANAKIIVNEPAVIAGIEEVKFLFNNIGVKVRLLKKDGQKVKKKEVIMTLRGTNKQILSAERTALNVLSRMSGVATECKKVTEKIKNTKVKIMLTRKTMPGFNLFDKKACTYGGAYPHRLNLSDMILIKDNHLKFFDSIPKALEKARESKKGKVEIEVETIKDAKMAAEKKADIIMLDNMPINKAREAIKIIRTIGKSKIELSGGITPEKVKDYAKLKPDMISMGYLTQKTREIDFSLEVIK